MRFFLLLLSAACALAQQATNEEAGSQACAGCHSAIHRKYSATGMARSSGRTGVDRFKESFDRAAFSDLASDAEYRVARAREGYRLEFSRSGAGVQGQRILEWFVGS